MSQSNAARRSQAARKVRRECLCGRVIIGNAAWWSHTHTRDGLERDGHGFAGARR